MKVLLTGLLVLIFATPALAAPMTTLEYSQWFIQPHAFQAIELRQQSSPTRGWRLWGARGQDDCDWGACYDNTFWGFDLTHRVRGMHHAYLGYYNMARQVDYEENGDTRMSHSGFRVGLTGKFRLTQKLGAIYDVAYMPFDQFRISTGEGPNGTPPGQGVGGMYRVGLRYTLSPSFYVEGGQWSFGFTLPGGPHGPWGVFQDHIWTGQYLSVGFTR